MHRRAAVPAGVIIALRVVVGGVAVEESIRHELVDALALPELRRLVAARGQGEGGNHKENACSRETPRKSSHVLQYDRILAENDEPLKGNASQLEGLLVILRPVDVHVQAEILQFAEGDFSRFASKKLLQGCGR